MSTIFCIGKSYAAHAREMGSAPDATGDPIVFLKPAHALVPAPATLTLPAGGGEIHHEAELVVRVGVDARVTAVALGLDLTDRSRQADAKQHGLPWAAAKGFRGSAPIGPFVPVASAPPLDALRFSFTIDGALRQRGDTSHLLRPIPAMLAFLDRWFGLRPGDLVFTGTPEGVGPLRSGQTLELAMDGVPAASARFHVA